MVKEVITINTLVYDICYTARKIYQFLTKEFKKFDITPKQFIVLATLFEQEGISQMDLALKLDKDKNTVKAIIDSLEKKGFLFKGENKIDKRASLFVTEKSKKIIPILRECEKDIINTLMWNITLEESKVSSAILSKIRENTK
ncbi:MarR family transcriptional regulator [Fusobacterium mortiferum]|nr:MarR family transcriptional regulator [Fusobacterium mortiferum]